ncbi:hypothetical protein SI65_08314 [Aspergillus cristatus]|uniref:Uncharacterized protein n=1 Tax=Aspergillus cristatus TaxID=573508 RepID=A0A1E3B5W8_ASPCR|nr:hypothetical protein SI65_08314 [Aspergillus cristatus]
MQLILATLLLPLLQALPVPVPAPVAGKGIEPVNACRESCPEALAPVCGVNAGGAFEIFDNPCMFDKANCEGLEYVQTDLLECRSLITDDQGAPFKTNRIFHDFLVLVLNQLLERNRWWRCKTKRIHCNRD